MGMIIAQDIFEGRMGSAGHYLRTWTYQVMRVSENRMLERVLGPQTEGLGGG